MRDGKMTANQRTALECYRTAKRRGNALSAQAREQGLNIRLVYDAIAALRRNGTLPVPGARRVSAQSDFVAVRVAPPAVHSAPPGVAVCHVRVGATLISCQQWPPAVWLTTLAAGGGDAATAEH